MPHLLTLTDLPVLTVEHILDRATALQNVFEESQKQQMIANMFFEPSTRTRFSFEVAEKRMGYHVLNFDASVSSTQKGESLYDTVRTLEEIGADAVVIRHSDNRYFDELKDRINISIINAGDGYGFHPTQSLLDLLTIQQEFYVLQGLTVVIVGDLRHSRVARSNAEILERMGAKVLLSGPKEWADRQNINGEFVPLDDAIPQADVVMLLRIQHERHGASEMEMTKEAYHQAYGLTIERAKQMKKESIIMHPGPVNRGVELADELVEGPQSRIFKQMKNGVAVRMAVLEWALEQQKEAMLHGNITKKW